MSKTVRGVEAAFMELSLEMSSPPIQASLCEWDSSEFFQLYSGIPALVKEGKKRDGMIELFNDARLSLESELSYVHSKDPSRKGKNPLGATLHALLALVYWLYPDYAGYNRQKVAGMMLKHSKASISATANKLSPSYALAIFVQLRVLSFLVRSKKVLPEEMANRRHDANTLLELMAHLQSSQAKKTGGLLYSRHEIELFKGMLYDGLAFSHYQLERDNQASLNFLDASAKSFEQARKGIFKKSHDAKNSIKRIFCDCFSSVAQWDYGLCYEGLAENHEGEEKLTFARIAREKYEKSYEIAKKTSWEIYKGLAAYSIAGTYARESESVSNERDVRKLLGKSVSIGEEALKCMSRWSTFESDFLGGSMIAEFYQRLAKHSAETLRKKYIKRSLELSQKAISLLEKLGSKSARYSQAQIGDIFYGNASYYRQVAIEQKTTTVSPAAAASLSSRSKKGEELRRAIQPLDKSLEYCLRSRSFFTEERHNKRAVDASLLAGEVCFELVNCNIDDERRAKVASLAKRVCKEAMKISSGMRWNEKVAESNWLYAQILDRLSSFEASSANYLRASKAYVAAGKASAINGLFEEYSVYMRALSRIEIAKLLHKKADFERSSKEYKEASNLISNSNKWRELSLLFSAESLIENAESESILDRPVKSSEMFDRAVFELSKFLSAHSQAEDLGEQRFARQLVDYARARINLEKSKESYTTGDIEQSIKKLASAETIFQELSSSPASDSARSNELESMAALCSALKSFQRAQVTGNSKLYLEARETFERASKMSVSKSLRPLLSGLAGFAAFLHYSSEIEKSLGVSFSAEKLAECNRIIESTQSIFQRIGNKSFLNMLKASKHVLNATIKMSAAEREIESASEKAKLYSEAQRSLSLASRYYKELGSSKRVDEAIRMINAVRNHRSLIPLARDIMAEVASNQIIYSAIANSSPVDQSQFPSRLRDAGYVVVECAIDKSYVAAGDACTLTVSISNLGREPISVVKIDEPLPEEFETENRSVSQNHSLQLNFSMDQGSTRQISLKYRPNNPGSYVWHPSLVYVDSLKNYRIARAQSVRSVVEQNSSTDFNVLLEEKRKLEASLEEALGKKSEESSSANDLLQEQIYSLKEKISKIDEEFLRTRHEYDSLQQDLSRVESDILAASSAGSNLSSPGSGGAHLSSELEAEARLLKAKIERRRFLLEQAHLL